MTEDEFIALSFILGTLLLVVVLLPQTMMAVQNAQTLQICTYCYKCGYACNITGDYYLECNTLNQTMCWEEMTTLK